MPIAITQRTLEAVAEFGLGRKDGARAKNFWALGLSLWLCGQSPDATVNWIERRFAQGAGAARRQRRRAEGRLRLWRDDGAFASRTSST